MKKRGALISLLIIFLSIILISNILAVEEKQITAYKWLESKQDTAAKRAALSSEDASFLLLALSYNETDYIKLNNTLMDLSYSGKCWPKPESSCDITQTAYAVIALHSIGEDTSKAESWLASKKIPSASNKDWYLQIDPPALTETACTIIYDAGEANVNITKNKKYQDISYRLPGTICFSITNDYWLKIATDCVNKAFDVSCESVAGELVSAYASLLYKSGDNYSIKSEGAQTTPTTLQIGAYCLGSGSCDYMGTLWATYALAIAGNKEEADSLIPFIVSPVDVQPSSIDTTQRDALLAIMIMPSKKSDYLNNLAKNQSTSTASPYWPRTGISYFDTAVAVYALADSDYRNSKNITKFIQAWNNTDKDSWDNNWKVPSLSLILYSLFPQRYTNPCERQARNEPDKSFTCTENPSLLSDDYIPNSTFSCKSYKGTQEVGSELSCYQLSPCTLAKGTCNISISNIDPNYYLLPALTCGRGQCWNKSLCYKPDEHRMCKSSCILKAPAGITEIMVPQYNYSCKEGVCCQETQCSLWNGTCRAEGEPGEIESKSLSSSCAQATPALKCWIKAPCEVANLECQEGVRCRSGYHEISKKCNIGAVCCDSNEIEPCTYTCKTGAVCEAPWSDEGIGNLDCDAGKVCCKFTDTCTTNIGYSCKGICADNEIPVPNLNCLYGLDGKGACCKPDYQCNAANDTCRTGTAATACRTNEKSNSLACPAGQTCCETVPTNTCVIMGYRCGAACLESEEKADFTCPSGFCCRPKGNISCTLLAQCAINPACKNQLVTDFWGRTLRCEYGRELTCDDDLDNDGDGFIDGEDSDCPTCSKEGYTCCSECESGYTQSKYDKSCGTGVCCSRCKIVTQTCSSQGYECCGECESGYERSTYDSSCNGQSCCVKCKSSKLWLWIVLGILIVGIGGAAAYYFLVLKKKPKAPRQMLPPGIGFRPPVRPYVPPMQQQAARPYIPPVTQPQQIQLRQPEVKPKLTKTDTELEETLKRLKKISEKK
jgi:hypothetical protein